MFDADRSMASESSNDADQQADKGSVASMSRDPINIDNDDLHCNALKARQTKNDKGKDTQKDPSIFITVDTAGFQWEDGDCGLMV